MQSISESTGKSRQPVQSYQPDWMAHWMRASSNAPGERCAQSACGNKIIDRVFRDANLTNELEASRSIREPEVIETENECLRMSSKGSGNEGMHRTLMKHGQDTDEMQAIRPSFDPNLEHGKAIDCKGGIQFSSVVPAADETSFREYRSISEETSKNLLDWVKTHVSTKDRSCATSMPFQERLVGSSMQIKPSQDLEKNEYDKGKAVVCPLIQNKSLDGLQGFNFDMNLSPELDVSSSREDGHRLMTAGLPDISLELPALPAAASSSEHACPSSSRTQSLEVDVLLAHAEQPNPKSDCLDDSSKADPTTRWVKRLKLSSLDSFARGKKSSNLVESSSHDKKREFFRSIFKSGITSSEPTPRKCHGKETSVSNGNQDLSKEDDHFIEDTAKKGKDLLLSHSWIKRWLRSGSQISQKKSKTLVVFEPQSSKSSLDDLQKKQSIAAMALMGKAIGRFQSCELQKRGAVTVWNTKAF